MIRLFRVYVPASTLVLLAFEIGVIISALCISVYVFGDLDPTDYLMNNLGLVSVALVSFSFIAGVYFQDLYSQIRVKSRILLVQQLLLVAGSVFLVQALISAVAPDLYMPFRVILLGSLISVVSLFAGRLLFSAYVLPRVAGERLLLIGDSPILEDLNGYLEQHPELAIQVARHIREINPTANPPELESLIREYQPNGIVVGMPDARLASELLELRFLGYSIQEAAGTYAKISNRESLIGLTPTRLLSSKEFEPSTRDLFFQAIVDRLIAVTCLIVLFPFLVLLAIVIKFCLGGPVVERQLRAGCGGVPFKLLKFRVSPAGSTLSAGQTRLGRLLTRTGIYALPQLLNVLCGQMSIVGPRPHRPEFAPELTRHIPFYPHRFKVAPGMTGWSQIQMKHKPGPPDCTLELEYDLYYIKYAAPMMDIFVILQSIKNIMLWGGKP